MKFANLLYVPVLPSCKKKKNEKRKNIEKEKKEKY